MKQDKNHLNLDIVSDLQYTEFCMLVLTYLKNVIHVNDDDFFKLEISLRELLNNAILHGNKCDPEKRVFVNFQWSKSAIQIRVRDQNREKVNFEQIHNRIKNNDVLAFSGRGIMIVKSYMDDIQFASSGDGSEITIVKKL